MEDSEKKENGGHIPCIDMDGVNPDRYFELYKRHLRSDMVVMFQKAKPAAKKFNIYSNNCQIYFEKAKVGQSYIAEMLLELSEAIGK